MAQGFATLTAVTAAKGTKKQPKPHKFKLEEFHLGHLLSGGGRKKKQSQKTMLAIVKALAGAHRAKVTIPGEGYNPKLDPYGGPAIEPHDPKYPGNS